MTSQTPPGTRSVLEEDALAGRLVPAEGELSDAVLLTGFLRRGRGEGSWRLYKAPELRDYVEFNEADVLHYEKSGSDLMPSPGSIVWLRSQAVLNRPAGGSRSIAAEFLAGEIVDERTTGGMDSLLGPGEGTAITWTITITVFTTITATLATGGQNTRKCCIQQPSAQSKCLCG